MYLRFTAPVERGGPVTRARVAPGLFRPAYCLARWDETRHDPARLAIAAELDWFEKHLPIPRRFGVRAKGVYWRDGICWFRDDAREMLTHAYALAALIEECGVPIERRLTRNPGQVLYRDDWQVVAKPERYRLH
jgi:hypothetical protein